MTNVFIFWGNNQTLGRASAVQGAEGGRVKGLTVREINCGLIKQTYQLQSLNSKYISLFFSGTYSLHFPAD